MSGIEAADRVVTELLPRPTPPDRIAAVLREFMERFHHDDDDGDIGPITRTDLEGLIEDVARAAIPTMREAVLAAAALASNWQDDHRQLAEHRAGIPAGDVRAIDDQRFCAAIDASKTVAEAAKLVEQVDLAALDEARARYAFDERAGG